jgi:hypothetical protein
MSVAGFQYAAQAKVANLPETGGRQKNVRRFQVAVNDRLRI